MQFCRDFQNSLPFSFEFQKYSLSLQLTRRSPKGQWVKICWLKGRYERYLLHSNSRKILVQEDAQPERPLRVYCMQYLHLCRCHRWRLLLQYHTAWAISSCLSLYEAMREAGMWDKREVEQPTSFRLYTFLLTADYGLL